MLEELIGFRLIELDNNGFKVEKNGKVRTFVFNEDYGACCGYNEIETNLFFDEYDMSNNPVITEVVESNYIKSRYSETDNLKITFMGESKPIGEIKSESGSGSGYCYGAHAWIECVETKETYEMTEW